MPVTRSMEKKGCNTNNNNVGEKTTAKSTKKRNLPNQVQPDSTANEPPVNDSILTSKIINSRNYKGVYQLAMGLGPGGAWRRISENSIIEENLARRELDSQMKDMMDYFLTEIGEPLQDAQEVVVQKVPVENAEVELEENRPKNNPRTTLGNLDEIFKSLNIVGDETLYEDAQSETDLSGGGGSNAELSGAPNKMKRKVEDTSIDIDQDLHFKDGYNFEITSTFKFDPVKKPPPSKKVKLQSNEEQAIIVEICGRFGESGNQTISVDAHGEKEPIPSTSTNVLSAKPPVPSKPKLKHANNHAINGHSSMNEATFTVPKSSNNDTYVVGSKLNSTYDTQPINSTFVVDEGHGAVNETFVFDERNGGVNETISVQDSEELNHRHPAYDITVYEDYSEDYSHRVNKKNAYWANDSKAIIAQLHTQYSGRRNVPLKIFPKKKKPNKLFPGALPPRRI